MSYYMGDYYRGDYYRGDPGIFSFLKKGLKIGAGLLGLGGGGGQIIRMAGPPIPVAERAAGAIMRTGRVVGGAIARHPVLSAAGAAGAAGAAAGALARGAAGGLPERGFHISKRTGNVVRNRHMRATNPKALRRALRRVGGFARIARRVLHFTSPRAARGRARFKFPKRRRAA